MGLFHVAYNGYVGKTTLPQCHPERSRGIFLAHRYSAVCETAGKGNPSVKGARKSRVQGGFLAALEMTVGGMSLFHVAYNGYVWKVLFLYRHSERSPRSFWHTGIALYVRQRKRGNLLRKEQESAECKEDFSTVFEMTVGKAADSMNLKF